ncbi:Kog1p [Sugiyamaella lignohabitans]|uniref:Kog1p n=1 Tax=Sugiyamaella lignohabitans TaxID=796027 RepID=A0A167E7Y5_9ASCO|nr:Kog1p [Sugiyamaella lignohabitans]ANB13751.1 Kog1p [Sugiyamaella lignohabitans]
MNDPKKSLEMIGKALQSQYEALSTRTKYKQSLDPNVEDAKRFCMSLRRSARDERILFHYNGHGVPRPTPSGEIWVFNRGYTQYIPVSVYDLQTWLGAPCIYAYDCHAAGHIVNNFNAFVEKRKENEKKNGPDPNGPPAEAYENCIQLAACRADEVLPMHPELPADLFTCCITSPIDIAVRWFVMQSPLLRGQFDNLSIPGKITDRRTPLGELNWIFTAITDTIAWSTLEGPLFKRLFRQDLVVAAMFRNFLLAVRIMRVHNCHPVSSPELPDTHNHPMWDAWDLAVDHCLVQLPMLQAASEPGGVPYTYKHSDFFEQQLTAFEVWLKYKSSDLDKPPEQLPVLLQVLLSQIHRLRALVLLSKYLDLGPKAVHLALSIGIFPYVLKLLQSPAPELKPVLVFIWARIMAVDHKAIKQELVKENGYAYFINILIPQDGPVVNAINVPEHLAMCAFVTALFCEGYKQGQRLCMGPDLFQACLTHTEELESPLLRQWATLCISQLWDGYPEAKWQALVKDKTALDRLSRLLNDPVPEVRTACIVALTTFLGDGETVNPNSPNINATAVTSGLTHGDIRQKELSFAISVLALTNDASSIVRREVVVFYSKFVKQYRSRFLVAAYSSLEEDVAILRSQTNIDDIRANSPAHGSIYTVVWRALLVLTEDPFPEVADYAQDVVDYVFQLLRKTPLSAEVEKLEQYLVQYSMSSLSVNLPELQNNSPNKATRVSSMGPSAVAGSGVGHGSHNGPTSESKFSQTLLKRSVSFANTLKQYAWGSGEEEQLQSQNQHPQHGRAGNGSASGSNTLWGGFGGSFVNSTGAGAGNLGNTRSAFPTVTTVAYGVGRRPRPVRYQTKDYTKKIVLPLASGFFEWSCEYFQEPQMCNTESDEPGSERYLERVWRKSRNEHIIAETQVQKEMAVYGGWSTHVGLLNNLTQPTKLEFAQFEPHLVGVDDRDGVTVWDWTESTKLNRFCNSNPVGTRITEAKFLNEDDVPLLLTGSSEGVVRIYRHYESVKNIELACSWRVLTDLLPAHRNSGLIAEWQQSRGALLVGGDVRVIRVWDAPRELCTSDIPARSGSPVTALTSDQVAGNIVVAGFGDGGIRVYDRRLGPRESLVKTWKRHKSWVVNVRMQRGGARELVSGSTDGQVYLWDIRLDEPVLSFQAHSNGMRAIDVHEHAPVIATGSQTVGIWSTNGNRVATVRPPSSGYSLGSKASQVSALSFHPHRMIMAVNNVQDAHIGVFNCTDDPSRKYGR